MQQTVTVRTFGFKDRLTHLSFSTLQIHFTFFVDIFPKNFTDIMFIARSHYLIAHFRRNYFFLFKGTLNLKTDGRRGRPGTIQKFTVPRTTRYLIKAWGARGGTHSYDYGDNPGTYYGGKGAFIEGKFRLNNGTVLNIVVGQRGGDSVEVKGGQSTEKTAAQLGVSVEDNAGTGGGGGSFVYTADNVCCWLPEEEGVHLVDIMVWMVRLVQMASVVWGKNPHKFEMEAQVDSQVNATVTAVTTMEEWVRLVWSRLYPTGHLPWGKRWITR